MTRTLFLLLAMAAGATAASVLERNVQHGDAVISYTDRGAGPAIVMVPSLGRGADDFTEIADQMVAKGYRVICPEPRGIGRSTGNLASLTLHDFAGDVAAVVEQAGVAPAVVLGHAFGNTVARMLATDRPDLIRGVILVTASGRAPMSESIQQAIARSSDLSLPADERLRYLAQAYFAPGADAAVWLNGWHPETQRAENQAFRNTPPAEYVTAGDHMPILDIQGLYDVIIPSQYSMGLKHELGDRVTVVVIPNAGHAMIPEQPAAVTDAIAAWMATR